MFRGLTIIRSLYNCNYNFWHWSTGPATIRSRCERMAVDPVKSIPEAVITVVRAPDDGCQHPKHVELPTDM